MRQGFWLGTTCAVLLSACASLEGLSDSPARVAIEDDFDHAAGLDRRIWSPSAEGAAEPSVVSDDDSASAPNVLEAEVAGPRGARKRSVVATRVKGSSVAVATNLRLVLRGSFAGDDGNYLATTLISTRSKRIRLLKDGKGLTLSACDVAGDETCAQRSMLDATLPAKGWARVKIAVDFAEGSAVITIDRPDEAPEQAELAFEGSPTSEVNVELGLEASAVGAGAVPAAIAWFDDVVIR